MSETESDERPSRSVFLEIVKFTILALLIVTPFRFYVAQPFIVSGASMQPTFDPKEYLVIDELSYRFSKPERGDVIIFRYPQDPSTYFIKRVIALPSETIRLKDGIVHITTVTGEEIVLDESYLATGDARSRDEETVLHETEYFVLGDNRSASSDSRVWGPLDEKYIIGRAYARLYPLDEIEYMPGDHTY
jgi:signal peptidase I